MAACHVAQYNIARMRAPIDAPIMQGFVSRLDELNHLADCTPGFVWRLKDDSDNSTAMRLYDDELIVVNMSVWDGIDALHAFAYRSGHGPVYAARHTWFAPLDGHTLVLWWVPAGHLPDAAEGKAQLDLLRRLGPSKEAFTFKQRFGAPEE